MTPGVVVWFTGLPASGKSTLAERVRAKLHRSAVVLDSDVMRDVLEMDSYSANDRDRFYRVRIVVETIEGRGMVVVPAFAVGRAQHLLHILAELRERRRIPDVPIFLDSPMAIDATELFLRHAGDHKLSAAQCAAMGKVARYSRTPDDSKAIDRRTEPAIIICVRTRTRCVRERIRETVARFRVAVSQMLGTSAAHHSAQERT